MAYRLSHGLAQSLVLRGTKQALDLADEAVEFHRLGVVIVAAGLDGLFAIPAHGVRRQPEHRHAAGGVIGHEAARRLPAVDDRQATSRTLVIVALIELYRVGTLPFSPAPTWTSSLRRRCRLCRTLPSSRGHPTVPNRLSESSRQRKGLPAKGGAQRLTRRRSEQAKSLPRSLRI